jgi:hypothetical protein
MAAALARLAALGVLAWGRRSRQRWSRLRRSAFQTLRRFHQGASRWWQLQVVAACKLICVRKRVTAGL